MLLRRLDIVIDVFENEENCEARMLGEVLVHLCIHFDTLSLPREDASKTQRVEELGEDFVLRVVQGGVDLDH